MISLGDRATLGFDLVWSSDARSTASDATRGTLQLWIASRSVWGAPAGLEWTWVQLLEHLTRFWACIVLEEMDPLGLGEPPEELRLAAERRWEGSTEEQRGDEEEELHAYLEAHDLAAGLAGVFPASVFLTREGNQMRLAARDAIVRLPFELAVSILSDLGDAIADRLGEVSEARAVAAREAWRARETNLPTTPAATATGISAATLIELFEEVAPDLLQATIRDLREPNELLVAARMTAGSVPHETVREVLRLVKRQPCVWTGRVDELANALEPIVAEHERQAPWLQGYAAAAALRTQLGLPASVRAEPASLLGDWGVPVEEIDLRCRLIDALCVWGPRHGPAVLLNRSGPHARRNGRRITLAHEIGHLVLDRRGGLPVGEVLGGRVPQELEKRARSFAAELLLPRAEAFRRVVAAEDPRVAIKALSEDYGVSLEVCAWQVRNGATSTLPPQLRAMLSTYVTNAAVF